MNRSRRHALSRPAGVCLAALLLSGCYAVTRDFPDLGDPSPDPGPVAGDTDLTPVRMPPPPRPPQSLDDEAAAALREDAGARLAVIADAVDPHVTALEEALGAAANSGVALDRRSAHFHFSRLSRLETEVSTLIRRLSALPGSDPVGADLRQRADALKLRLRTELDSRRPALTALGPAAAD